MKTELSSLPYPGLYGTFYLYSFIPKGPIWRRDKLLKDKLLKDKLRKDKLLKDKLLTRQTPDETNS